jgi:hypothetical protein
LLFLSSARRKFLANQAQAEEAHVPINGQIHEFDEIP